MASTSTINQWIDQLVVSIVTTPKTNNRQPRRKQLETFRRRLRHHPFGRTNQFDVKDRLDGLEEKFQILNREDLSDALHERRIELRDHESRWLPDALDLLLRLSDDPVGRTTATALYDFDSQLTSPSAIKWSDAGNEDQFDEDGPIWKKPEWSESSSEDEFDASTVQSSPVSLKQSQKTNVDNDHPSISSLYEDIGATAYNPPPAIIPETSTNDHTAPVTIEEIQLIREVLLVVQGYPSRIFLHSNKHGLYLDPRIVLKHVSPDIPDKVLQRAYVVRNHVNRIRKWIQKQATLDYLQLVQQEISYVLQQFLEAIGRFTQGLVQPDAEKVVSLLSTVVFLEESAGGVRRVAAYVQAVYRHDAVDALGHLYQVLGDNFHCCDEAGLAIFMPIFTKALALYMQPIVTWLKHGTIESSSRPFFIRNKKHNTDHRTIWHSGHEYELDGPCRLPDFLVPFAKDIFICGKTSEFLRTLFNSLTQAHDTLIELHTFSDEVQKLADDPIVPFPAALTSLLNTTITATLNRRTAVLKQTLQNQCGLSRCLDAFDHLYFCKNGMIINNLEGKIFKRMDRCQDNWNDRFLVADILEDVCADVKCIDIDCISVRSIHTSSRSMESRRRSVKIMGALAIDYTLPWPVANIIPNSSIKSYCRISLHLAQIRRAKYMLERVAYPAVCTGSISDDAKDQKNAQVFVFILTNFVNTLYDHFTIGVIDPLTNKMRANLEAAPTVDEMISAHRSYIRRLQDACLITKSYKVLHETLVGLLDMCIRFADLVASSSSITSSLLTSTLKQGKIKTKNDSSEDFETSSFISAQSQSWRHRRRDLRCRRRRGGRERKEEKRRQGARHDDDVLPSSSSSSSSDEDENSEDFSDSNDENDDDDGLVSSGEGEGYSSFIVLDDNTTVAMEIRRLQLQFKRQLDFLVAGLKGVSKAGGGATDSTSTGEDVVVNNGFDVLAERLTWRQTRGVMGIIK